MKLIAACLLSLACGPVWAQLWCKDLPKGYASVGHADEHALYHGERDRVLSDTEEGAIRKVLIKKEEHLLFTMALETAMRLSEMFTLKKEDVDVARRTIFLDRTKTSRQGRSGKRQVPITSVLLDALLAKHPATTNLTSTDFCGLAVDRGDGAAAHFG